MISTLLGAGLLALTFAPTARGYSVEKINNWSAVCAYLWKNIGPGDVAVGDYYADGALTWCFDVKRGGPYVPVVPAAAIDLRELVGQGRGVWYINVDPSAPNLDYVRNTFAPIARTDWDGSGLTLPTGSEAAFYPEWEGISTIYHYSPPDVPASITFHDMKGAAISPDWPDYVGIPAGRSYSVRLKLDSTAPRQLRLNALKLAGRPVVVSVDGKYVGTVSGESSGASWEDVVLPILPGIGNTFTVQFANPGQETSAISNVGVELVASDQ